MHVVFTSSGFIDPNLQIDFPWDMFPHYANPNDEGVVFLYLWTPGIYL